MALQGDGNGIVSIPTATATGDFSIVFSAITLTAGTEIIVGDNSASNDFIAIFATAKLGTRINGENTTQTSTTSIGQTVKYEVSRVGTALQVKVDDVVFSNHSFTGTFVLDTFFSYNSGALKGSMLLSGTCDMTGFTGAGDRSYDFEGSGTTLVDTISGENGTLSGFTSGCFSASAGNITVTSVGDYGCKQRDGSGHATFTIAGTCEGVTDIEYSYDNATWFTLDAAPTTTFTGSVLITAQQTVYLRDGTNNAIVAQINHLTAAMVVACWWQSNMAGRVTNNQPITVTGNNPIPVMYKNGSFFELDDPTGTDGSAAGSLLPLLAQNYSDAGTPVCFANVALGSSSIDYWNGNGTTGYGKIQSLAADTDGLEFTLSIGGETDTAAGMSQAEMETKLGNTVDSIFADFGVNHYLVTFPYGNTTGGDPTNMNAAFAATVANNANCLFGGNLQTIDIDTGTTTGNDGTHIKSDADAATAAGIIWSALNSVPSLINLTATGLPDGTYQAQIFDDSVDPMVRIVVDDISFTSGIASYDLTGLLLPAKAVYTRIDTPTPLTTGVTCIGTSE